MFSDSSRISCPFYGFLVESASHLFVTCEIAYYVWYGVFRSLGWQVVIHHDLIGLFQKNFILYEAGTNLGVIFLWFDTLLFGLFGNLEMMLSLKVSQKQ